MIARAYMYYLYVCMCVQVACPSAAEQRLLECVCVCVCARLIEMREAYGTGSDRFLRTATQQIFSR